MLTVLPEGYARLFILADRPLASRLLVTLPAGPPPEEGLADKRGIPRAAGECPTLAEPTTVGKAALRQEAVHRLESGLPNTLLHRKHDPGQPMGRVARQAALPPKARFQDPPASKGAIRLLL
jgi:hypothetical protein